jgi:hypothetical protein
MASEEQPMAGAYALRVMKIGASDAHRRNMPHLGHSNSPVG